MLYNKLLFEVRRSHSGRGLFALTSITKGTRIIEYVGIKIPTTVADTLKTKYLFDLENGCTIDGAIRSNLARYVNHACEPNCEASIEDGRIFFNAVRNITSGEELTLDYGEEYFDEFIKPRGCRCVTCNKKTTSMS